MADFEVISWLSPVSGFETMLTNQGWVDVVGWRGFDMVELQHIEEETPFEFGSHYRRTKIPPRELELDLIVWGEDRQGLFNAIQQLRSTFDYQRGIGKLKIVPPDENAVYIGCLYQEGLEGKSGEDDGVAWRKVTLVFRAFDPFFYSLYPVNLAFLIQENPPTWFPLLPLQLGGDAIAAEFEVFNGGDVFTYPTWEIRGPGQNPKMTNHTTGKTLQLDGVVLGEGESILIDTKRRIIQHSNGANLFPALAWGTGLWTLAVGNNQIKLELPSATESSLVRLTFAERYMGV